MGSRMVKPNTPRGRAWIHHCDSHARTWLSRLVPSRWGDLMDLLDFPGLQVLDVFLFHHSGLGIPSLPATPTHEATVADFFHEPDMDNLQVRMYT